MTDSLPGKRVLVDVWEYYNPASLRARLNYAGVIVSVGENRIESRRDDSDVIETLRASAERLEPAERRDYWLRSTGEAVDQPDFVAAWEYYDVMPGQGSITIAMPPSG